MIYPSEIDLIGFFGTEPSVEDELYTYQIQGSCNLLFSFSFNTSDDSVQTVVKQDERIIALTSHESLNRMWIDEKTLRAEFESDGYKTTLTLTVRPFEQIEWSGLRTI